MWWWWSSQRQKEPAGNPMPDWHTQEAGSQERQCAAKSIAAPPVTHVEERVAPRHAETPSGPRRVMRMESPRIRARPPERRPDPGPVRPARAPHDGAAPGIAAEVARRVADIHLIGRRVVDLDVLHVVNRCAGRDLVDVVGRDGVREEPR